MLLSALPLFVVFVPLLNFFLMVVFSNHTRSWRHLSLLVIGNMLFLLLSLVSIFPAIARGESFSITVGSWIMSDLLEVNWVFAIDALTYTMLLVVLTVSTLVHLYSTEYMSEDPHTTRFISYLSLFTFFMLILVTSNNFVSLFLGWEGVGLCSYLLISFWFTRIQANKAAIKAMVVNRVSDLFFTIGILAIFLTFQTVEFNTVFALAPFFVNGVVITVAGYEIAPLTLITFLLFLGAMGKSAQIGLHTWLPDAMEGPTPVSALIHAATMVTAGVFLIIRCSSLFELVPSVLNFIVVIGAATAFMAATSGLLQNDLKKVIAYSTCSQLGYMIFVCGLSGYSASLFHLSTHAFFKALLFLSAGAVIHAVASEQDMRKFGGLARMLPYTYAAFFVGSIALMGVPFLSGFYSKDLILEIAGGTAGVTTGFAYTLGLISAFFTTFYSFRLLFLAFYGPSRTARLPLEHTHELSGRMGAALFSLAIGSVFLGILGRDLFVGPGTDFWNDSVAIGASLVLGQLSGEFMSTTTKLIPLFSAIVSTLLVFYVYGAFSTQYTVQRTVPTKLATYRFLTHKWGFDTVYNQFVNRPLMEGAYNITFSLIDKGVLEFFGPTGLGRLTVLSGRVLSSVQTGRVYDYAGFMLAALFIALIAVDVFLFDSVNITISVSFIASTPQKFLKIFYSDVVLTRISFVPTPLNGVNKKLRKNSCSTVVHKSNNWFLHRNMKKSLNTRNLTPTKNKTQHKMLRHLQAPRASLRLDRRVILCFHRLHPIRFQSSKRKNGRLVSRSLRIARATDNPIITNVRLLLGQLARQHAIAKKYCFRLPVGRHGLLQRGVAIALRKLYSAVYYGTKRSTRDGVIKNHLLQKSEKKVSLPQHRSTMYQRLYHLFIKTLNSLSVRERERLLLIAASKNDPATILALIICGIIIDRATRNGPSVGMSPEFAADLDKSQTECVERNDHYEEEKWRNVDYPRFDAENKYNTAFDSLANGASVFRNRTHPASPSEAVLTVANRFNPALVTSIRDQEKLIDEYTKHGGRHHGLEPYIRYYLKLDYAKAYTVTSTAVPGDDAKDALLDAAAYSQKCAGISTDELYNPPCVVSAPRVKPGDALDRAVANLMEQKRAAQAKAKSETKSSVVDKQDSSTSDFINYEVVVNPFYEQFAPSVRGLLESLAYGWPTVLWFVWMTLRVLYHDHGWFPWLAPYLYQLQFKLEHLLAVYRASRK